MTIYKLEYPIKENGLDITELNLRRPRVMDLLVMDQVQGDINKSISLVSNLGMISNEAVKSLDAQDFMKINLIVEGYLNIKK